MQRNKSKVHLDTVIRKDDLERYEIVIPFLNIAGRRRKQFLCSELEKLHPCFSDEFAFDSVIKKVCKKGLCEDVFVMNKYRLAEYERKRHFSGAGFFVNEGAEKKYFAQKRLFVDKKWRLTVYGIIACVMLGSVGIIFSVLGAVKSTVNEETVNRDVARFGTENPVGQKVSVPVQADFSLARRLLEITQEADGKISSFEWRLEINNGVLFEKMNASVKGIFPESLTEFAASVPSDGKPALETVLYEEGVPQITVVSKKALSAGDGVTVTGTVTGREGLLTEVAAMSNADFNKGIRAEITKHEGVLKEEKAPPYHIEFLCKTDSLQQTKEMLIALNEIISGDKRFVTSISINRSGAADLRFGLSIEKADAWGAVGAVDVAEKSVFFDLSDISQNMELFMEKEQVPSGKGITPKNALVQTARVDSNYKKIGEIKRADNRTVVYYKSPDGKIKSIEKW